mmetsp:Transcript_23109/g.72093  ORF Transcript_23109/g.72093 Transcript_23109/m.72093 type:complete len:252 (-) Transcript_23109:7060-7815(-)
MDVPGDNAHLTRDAHGPPPAHGLGRPARVGKVQRLGQGDSLGGLVHRRDCARLVPPREGASDLEPRGGEDDLPARVPPIERRCIHGHRHVPRRGICSEARPRVRRENSIEVHPALNDDGSAGVPEPRVLPRAVELDAQLFAVGLRGGPRVEHPLRGHEDVPCRDGDVVGGGHGELATNGEVDDFRGVAVDRHDHAAGDLHVLTGSGHNAQRPAGRVAPPPRALYARRRRRRIQGLAFLREVPARLDNILVA